MSSGRLTSNPPPVTFPHGDASGEAALLSQVDLLLPASWRQLSQYSWICGQYTICAVRYRGDLTYELWKNAAFCARARDAQTLRKIAASGGAIE